MLVVGFAAEAFQANPLKGLGPQLAAMFADQVRMTEPNEVIELGEGPLEVAGLGFTVDHTPGHTLTLDDRTVVLPGHGTTSTIGAERVSNPYLTGVAG